MLKRFSERASESGDTLYNLDNRFTIINCSLIQHYALSEKVSYFPVPRQHVTNQTRYPFLQCSLIHIFVSGGD